MDTRNTPELSIHKAAAQGHYGIVEEWLNKDPASVDSRDDFQNTPLMEAAEEGHPSIVKLLLTHGANPWSENKKKATPLSRLVWKPKVTKQHHQIVALLLQQGITADQLTHSNRSDSLLHRATKIGHAEIVRLFLMHGADPNAVNKGNTAWCVGYAQYNPDIIATFLKHPNINPDIRSTSDDTSVIQRIVSHLKRTNLGKEQYKNATNLLHRKLYEENAQEHAQLIQCLNYFIFAGATLNEEEIRQACHVEFEDIASEDFYPHIKILIDEALTMTKTVEAKLSEFPSFIQKHSKHLLLSSETERNAFLQAIETLYDDHVNERKSLFFSCPTEMINQIVQNRLDDLIGDYNFPDLNHNQAEFDFEAHFSM